MKRKWLLGFGNLICGVALAAAAEGENPQLRTLSLQDVIQMAVQHNLDVQITRYTPQIARYSLSAAYAGYDPIFGMSGQHNHNESGASIFSGILLFPGTLTDADQFNTSIQGLSPIGTRTSISGNAVDTHSIRAGLMNENSSGSAAISVTQPLLKNFWFDATRLNILVGKNRVKYSDLTLKSQIINTVTSAEMAYYDLIYNRENVLVQEKAVELAQRLVDENKKRVEVGAMAPLDEQQAEAQAASSQAALIAARSALGTQERLVKSLMTDKFTEWQPFTLIPSGTLMATEHSLDLQQSWSKGLTQRPDFQQAKLDVERMGIQLKYDRNQLYPELDLIGSYGYTGGGSQEQFSGSLNDIQQRSRPSYYYGGQITLPLANVAARNAYKSDKASQAQIVLTLKKLEQVIMIQIDNDIGIISANFQQAQATRAAREYAEAALAAEQKKLENGKSTTYTVLQMQRDLTTARGGEIQALDTYNKSLSQLSQDEATTLDRLGINLEIK